MLYNAYQAQADFLSQARAFAGFTRAFFDQAKLVPAATCLPRRMAGTERFAAPASSMRTRL